MSAITITISPTRTLVADGRLVAGESADISVVGGVPAALYLVGEDREVVAACTSFVPGESSATGVLNLATVPLANLVADIPAGRAIPLQAILEDAAGDVIGYGLVAVVSAPMPEALDPLDGDYIYAKLSDLQAYLTRAEAAATYATRTELAGKFDLDTDSATPSFWAVDENGRQGFYARGAVYLLPNGEGAAAGGTLARLADIPAAPVQSVNGQTGAVALGASDIPYDNGSIVTDVGAALGAMRADLRYALGETITATAQLADRTVNRVAPQSANTADIVLTFPASQTGARDFLILVTNTAGNTGSITFTPPTGATVYGDGFTNSPASGETWLYSVTEVAANTFWAKSVKMEVAQ